MRYPVNIPSLEARDVVFDTGGFGRSMLVVDGQPLSSSKKIFTVSRPGEQPLLVHLKSRFLDPVPNLEVDGALIQIAPALKSYQYLWCALPLVLLFVGGALGGAIGGAATAANIAVFRSVANTAARYVVTGLISIASLVAFVAVAAPVALLFGRS